MIGEATSEEYNAAIPPHPYPHHLEDNYKTIVKYN
tara:strand:+ start:550 stop:654 length:105 start_codon:yes stop_codon:yes gene_type:complete